MKSRTNKIPLITALFLVMISSMQCSLENPVAPSWEIDVNITLINNYAYLNEFLPIVKSPGKADSFIVFTMDTIKITGGPKMVDLSAFDLQIESGTMQYTLNNHLPVGIDGMIYISDDSSTVFTAPKIVIGPLRVLPALYDSAGRVTEAGSNRLSVLLDSAQIAFLSDRGHSVFAGYSMVSYGTNGLTVKAGYSDYLHSNVLVTVRKKVM
ncbi:MAG: hypothetical protein Q8O74_00490 [bacterium]|nr:hypothetical protein [bacterium]